MHILNIEHVCIGCAFTKQLTVGTLCLYIYIYIYIYYMRIRMQRYIYIYTNIYIYIHILQTTGQGKSLRNTNSQSGPSDSCNCSITSVSSSSTSSNSSTKTSICAAAAQAATAAAAIPDSDPSAAGMRISIGSGLLLIFTALLCKTPKDVRRAETDITSSRNSTENPPRDIHQARKPIQQQQQQQTCMHRSPQWHLQHVGRAAAAVCVRCFFRAYTGEAADDQRELLIAD